MYNNEQTWDFQQSVFLDETAFIAFMNPEDPRYIKARSLFLDFYDQERNFITTNSIIFEVHEWFRNEFNYSGSEFFLNVIDKAVNKGNLMVIPGRLEFETESRRLLIERPELQFSLSEALITVVMTYHKIKRIFTFNPNFMMLVNLNKELKVIPSAL